MKKITLTSALTALTLTGYSYTMPATEAKQEAIPSAMTLAELQEKIYAHEPLCRAATIGISTNVGTQGSGVIISKDGLILTAAHVVDELGSEFTVHLANGKSVKAVTLLINLVTDSAVAKIIDPVPARGFAFRPIRIAADLVKGDWCTVIANAGGIQLNRPAPLRIGRVLTFYKTKDENVLVSDCTMTSGDSGGPLFDSDGNVCAINDSVGANSALDNKHVSSNTFIRQWGDYLLKKKSLPTAEEVKRQREAELNTKSKSSSSIPKKVLPSIKKAHKIQFPDLPDTKMDASLKGSAFERGRLEGNGTPGLASDIEKIGISPLRYEIKAKFDAEKKPEQKQKAKLKELGADAEAIQLRRIVIAKFGDMSEKAMQFILSKFEKNEAGKYKLKVSPKDIEKLKTLGVNVLGNDKTSDKDMLTAIFKKKYGNDLSKEALEILLSSSLLDKETGRLKLNLNATSLKRLTELGLNIQDDDAAHLIPLAENHGDSADTIREYFPMIPSSVHLIQGGKRVGLATAISADGKLLCKSSSLVGDDEITISVAGKSYPVGVVARDEVSDLALIKAALERDVKLAVVKWDQTPRRGTLIVSTTEAKPMLGVVSVDKRIIPEKAMGVGNSAVQDLSALAGELSPRRTSFPEAFSHDALIWNDDCGGPVYSLNGKLLGINIARYSRITSYALTQKSVQRAIRRMQNSK